MAFEHLPVEPAGFAESTVKDRVAQAKWPLPWSLAQILFPRDSWGQRVPGPGRPAILEQRLSLPSCILFLSVSFTSLQPFVFLQSKAY